MRLSAHRAPHTGNWLVQVTGRRFDIDLDHGKHKAVAVSRNDGTDCRVIGGRRRSLQRIEGRGRADSSGFVIGGL